MALNELYWHDGVLRSMSFDAEGCLALNCDLYPLECSPERKTVILKFIDVKNFVVAIDVEMLCDNARAGNINNGHVYEMGARSRLKLFINDGYIDIVAAGITQEVGSPSVVA